jgi:hypothetical protein
MVHDNARSASLVLPDGVQLPGERAPSVSYFEAALEDGHQGRIGAGPPDVVLHLPDNAPNVRLFILEPIDPFPWRARLGKATFEDGKLTDLPWAHSTQAVGCWLPFFWVAVPLLPVVARHVQDNHLLERFPSSRALWIRVGHKVRELAIVEENEALAQLSGTANDTKDSVTYARLWGRADQLTEMLRTIVSDDDVNRLAESGRAEPE